MKSIRIWFLKKQLKAAYQAYLTAVDILDDGKVYPDGLSVTQTERNRCDLILAKLAELDPQSVPFSRVS